MTNYTPPPDLRKYRVLGVRRTRRAEALLRKVIALDEACRYMFRRPVRRSMMSAKRRLALCLPNFREVNAEQLAATRYAQWPCYQGDWALPCVDKAGVPLGGFSIVKARINVYGDGTGIAIVRTQRHPFFSLVPRKRGPRRGANIPNPTVIKHYAFGGSTRKGTHRGGVQ